MLQQPVDLDDVGGHAADVAAGALEGGAGRGEQGPGQASGGVTCLTPLVNKKTNDR